MYREISFKRIPDGFRMKERDVNGCLVAVSSISFEAGFRRMSELKAEGFFEEEVTFEKDFLYIFDTRR